jgi:5-methylcytosine-specific restriction endonuclease McrA
MNVYISAALRARITEQSRHRCGYCLRSEELMGMALTIDHLIPQSAGGPTTEENLWLACHQFNSFKGTQTHATDSVTDIVVPLFNPRQQSWPEHFAWSEDGTEIIGITPCGRATVLALKLNTPEIIVTRRMWVSAGWWPPLD